MLIHLECGSYYYDRVQIIMNKKKKSILCIVAHPDDEALGLGGTIIKHIEHGHNVQIIILSVGEEAKLDADKDPSRREQSAYAWSKSVGSEVLKIFDYADQRLDTIPKLEIIQELEKIIKIIKPDIIYTHHDGDINHDHQVVSHAVLTACRPMNSLGIKAEIRTFETISSTEQAPYSDRYIFKPNYYVDVENVWDKKISSLKAYNNEMGIYPHPRSMESIEALAIKRGSEAGLKKAEAFCILKKIWK